MSNEDLQQIVAIMAAIEQRLTELIRNVENRLTELIRDVETRILTELESVSRRVERIDSTLSGVLTQMAGITKSLSQGEKLTTQLAHTQIGQQRAIDQLSAELTAVGARLRALEGKSNQQS